MNHTGTKLLETNRLVLRRLTINDSKEMFNNWASSKEVCKFLSWPAHENIETTKSILNIWIEKYNNFTFYQWGIVIKATNELIGTISCVNFKERLREIEVGYCIGKKWWNKGYTSEALARLIEFFFKEVNANRIVAIHDTNNPNSGKVMLKCNMKKEGILRMAMQNSQNEYCDVAIYSILKKEYE